MKKEYDSVELESEPNSGVKNKKKEPFPVFKTDPKDLEAARHDPLAMSWWETYKYCVVMIVMVIVIIIITSGVIAWKVSSTNVQEVVGSPSG